MRSWKHAPWLAALTFVAGCAQQPRPPRSMPEHLPGDEDERAPAAAPVPETGPEPGPPTWSDGPQPQPPPGSGPRAHMVSGHDPKEGRLLARPHPPGSPSPARGTEHLGLGDKRDGVVFVPSRYDPRRPTPLVVVLHGAGRDAEHILDSFQERANAAGVILVVPDSRAMTWDLVLRHKFGADVGFIDRALTQAFDRFNVDPERVAIAGFSDGASEALSLGLTNGDLFAQILAFSPGFAAPGLVTGQPRVFISHGVNDRVLPINGSSRRMVDVLEKTGYDVRFKQFDGGHEMPEHVLDAAFTWLETGR